MADARAEANPLAKLDVPAIRTNGAPAGAQGNGAQDSSSDKALASRWADLLMSHFAASSSIRLVRMACSQALVGAEPHARVAPSTRHMRGAYNLLPVKTQRSQNMVSQCLLALKRHAKGCGTYSLMHAHPLQAAARQE